MTFEEVCLESLNVRVSQNLHAPSIFSLAERYKRVPSDPDELLDALILAIQCMDLTTLAGDDTRANVARLAYTAAHPVCPRVRDALVARGREGDVACGAVCVYPSCVGWAADNLADPRVRVAAVATGFPSGQFGLETRLGEIRDAVGRGASEIDIVLRRSLVLEGRWRELQDEVRACKAQCGGDGGVHMKTILATGELGSLANVYRASMVAMMAGSDFIKTSTGKEGVNATLPVGVVMCRAIRDFHRVTGRRVGLKPAGGVRSWPDAVSWINLVSDLLGPDWLNPGLFRIGASGLLDSVHAKLFHMLMGRPPSPLDYLH